MKTELTTPEERKSRYKKLCETEKIPLFAQHWWMESVCKPAEWDVILIQESGKISAAMPYHLRTKFGFRCIIQPQLTQYNGIWINYPTSCTKEERLSIEKKQCFEIIASLDRLNLSLYQQTFHHSFTNWLPFYWKKFSQTTRYTYLLDNLSDLDTLFNHFNRAKQKQIRKASELQLVTSMTASEFYAHHKHTLAQRGETIFYTQALFLKIHQAAVSRNQGAILALKDSTDSIHSCLFTVWDSASGYNLICSTDLNRAQSGASSRISWEAIRFLQQKTASFDFEGSMIEGVEASFRQFGTTQTPYFQIQRFGSLLFKGLMKLK